jgi:hypothetical protein
MHGQSARPSPLVVRIAIFRWRLSIRSLETEEQGMKKYVIERNIPGVGKLNAQELKGAAQTSNAALEQLSGVEWVESYVTEDKTFCVYLAKDEEVIKEHARLSGFPADRITEVKGTISPKTAG